MDKVASDLEELGYIGETNNKKLAYLVASSRKLKRPLSAIIVSSSGAGKTGLMNAVGELIPKEDKMFLSRLTPQALYYMPPDALTQKLIVVDERNGSSMADYSVRTMQTSNVLTLARANRKMGEDGIKTIHVSCAYMESTTSGDMNPENISRCLILHLDESSEATEAILTAQRLARKSTKRINKDNLLQWHHQFQTELKSMPVLIPFVGQIKFPNNKVVYRREQEKYLTLIEASALVHQNSREQRHGCIIAEQEDYEIVYELYMDLFEGLQQEVGRQELALLQKLKSEKLAYFGLREIITLMGWSYSSTYRTIQELLKYEYIERNHEVNGKKQIYHCLNYDIYGNTVRKLKAPQDLFMSYPEPIHNLFSDNKPVIVDDSEV